MSTDLRITLISGVLILLTIAVAIFFWQQRPETVILGTITHTETPTLPNMEDEEPDPDAPLVLSETGEMVPARTPRIVGDTIDTTYECPGGEEFTTGYDLATNALLLTLPTDDTYVLPQAVVTAGARYAKWDDSVVFFEEEGTAEVSIDGEVILQDCVSR